MSRDDGLKVADQDTGFMADIKVVALARRLRDPIGTGAAIALHDAVRLASWGAGQRLTLDESLPGWWVDPVDELAEHLVAVGLLDGERRIPARAWESWFGPAYERREYYRTLGAKGGKATHANSVERTVERTVERHGAKAVLAVLEDMADIPDARAAAFGIRDRLTARHAPPAPRRIRNTVEANPTLREIRDGYAATYAARDASSDGAA